MEAFLLAWAFGQLSGFSYLCAMTMRELRKRDLTAGFSLRGGPLTAGVDLLQIDVGAAINVIATPARSP